jgi:hypothetical protein
LVVTGLSIAVPASAAATTVTLGEAPVIPTGSIELGPMAASTPLSLDIVFAPRDPAALDALLQQLYDPSSPEYHDFLAKGQFGPLFGAAPNTIINVASTLTSLGLTPGQVSSNDLTLPVSTTVAGAEVAFGVQIHQYGLASGRVGFANTSPPKVPSTIAADLIGVLGLSDVATQQPLDLRAPTGSRRPTTPAVLSPNASGPIPCTAASNTGYAYTANQLANAYGLDTGAYAGGRLGVGETVALFELEPFLSSDISAYESCYGISTTVNVTTVDGGAGTGDGSGEAALDIEDVAGLAPDARIDVYEAPSTSNGPLDEYTQIADDDSAQVVSSSWGLCEPLEGSPTAQSEETVFEQMATQGQSMLAAAGDSGSEACYYPQDGYYDKSLAVGDPASDPYVTGVGGTDLTAIGPAPTETVWNESALGAGAGGGGISEFWQMPSWQQTLGVNSDSSGTPCDVPSGSYCREVPDVAASADPYNGYVVYWDGGWTDIGGTSAASPLWAALTALADEGCSSKAGFLNPTLYAHEGDLNDITSGNNDYTGTHGGLYPATVGYDMASGLGTPTSALFSPGVLCNTSYTVTFNANGGTGTMAAETDNVPTALTANAFTYSGYTFNDWNTVAGGTGTSYANGATYPFTASVTLYAQWTGSPPSVTTGAATSVTSSTATLNGRVNPNGYTTTYYFEYGTTTSYGTTTTSTSAGSGTSAVAATASLTGLSPGTTYDFQLVATNANGTTDGGNLTFTTSSTPPPPPPPPPPVTVTLTQGSPTSATVAYGAGYSGHSLTVTDAIGTVSYTEATSVDSTEVVASGTGAISAATSLAPGTYAVGGGDSDTNGDTGTWTFSLTLAKASQTITFTAPSSGTMNGSASLSPTASSGLTVTLSVDGTTTNDACSISGDTVSYLHAGSCVIDANQAGDANYLAATQVHQTITVAKATARTALKLSTTKVTYGDEQTEQLSVTVSPQYPGTTPTGTMTITESGTTLCVITLSSGKGSCTRWAKRLNAGTYQLVATYEGSTDFDSSTSAKETLTVAKATSKTVLKLSATKVTYGDEQVLHLSVAVSPQYSGSPPTGRVTIKASTTTLCTISLSGAKGSCTLSAKELHAGAYSLVATYSGSTNFKGSTSAKETLTVAK